MIEISCELYLAKTKKYKQMKALFSIYCSIFILPLFLVSCASEQESLRVYLNTSDAKLEFALAEIEQKNNLILLHTDDISEADISIVLCDTFQAIKNEGFALTVNENGRYSIRAMDASGAMYAGLELAEQMALYGCDGVKNVTRNPYMQMRGTKFNIPLDVRTPSYTDMSDVAQNNIPEMWSLDFWKEYIDNMARYRYNYISLWSLQPFPSMVITPGYEAIALDNVERSLGQLNEYYDLNGTGFDSPEVLDSIEVLKKISIDEKIAFWQEVMAYGKSRNVDFYVITWNIFTYGIDGKYGITDDINNKITRDYYRKSVAQMFRSYPDLAGIGLTTGENMRRDGKGVNSAAKEDWAFDTYAKGILEVAKEMPDRQFKFIHRQHQTGALEIAEKFQPIYDQENVDFLFSFKYAKAHVYSAIDQPYHENFVKEIEGLKTIWTLRNDDIYLFRWGAPDYVRDFIKNIPYDVSQGYYYGSDQWVWGREFTSMHNEEARQLEVVKHWYHWMMWGRLGYDPELTNARFSALLQNKFPQVDGPTLFDAWQAASMVYPVTTGFHWGALDFKWYIEGCRSHYRQADTKSGFHGVESFISLPPHPYAGYQSIPDYVQMIKEQGTTSLKTPLEVASLLEANAKKAMSLLQEMKYLDNPELQVTVNDILVMSLMGEYYAHKIAGATYVALYRSTKDKAHQDKAVEELTEALSQWEEFVKTAKRSHKNPIWTNRVGYMDWEKMTKDVQRDIALARQ